MVKRELNFEGNSPLLYLVASPIGNLKEFPPRAIEVLNDMDYVACEDTRNTGKLLKLFSIDKPLISCHEHNEEEASDKIISLLLGNKKVAYLSDAGYPVVSDPGARLSKRCLERGVKVSVVNGPNAAIMALVASGLDSKHFYFYGFLDSKPSARRKELESLKDFPETIIFYEAPHRIQKTLHDLALIFGDERRISIGRELTKKHEEFIRGALRDVLDLPKETLLGEMVLVVEGKKKEKEIKEEDMASLLKEKLQTLKAKDAIKETSLELGIAKNEVYDFYLKNFKKS